MKKSYLAVLLSFWLISSSSSANLLQPMPLQQQYAQADVVLLVQAGRGTVCDVNSAWVSCVELVELVTLKGPPSVSGTARYLVTYTRVEEERVNSCVSGNTYLMFLRGQGRHLYPLRGYWSILSVNSGDTVSN